MTSDSPSPIPDSRPFSLPTRVYWEDTDAGGVVYHARYLAFMERARTEWMRVHGYDQEPLRMEHDLVFAVREVRMDFRRPARLDDALQVTVALAQCRRASMAIVQSVLRDGEVLVEAEVRLAALAASTFRPRAIPDPLYARLIRLVENGADE